jgi:hypothetical protein
VAKNKSCAIHICIGKKDWKDGGSIFLHEKRQKPVEGATIVTLRSNSLPYNNQK